METENANQTKPEGYQPIFQQVLPNSTVILVLGIFSIVGCWCFGIPGLILGIITMVLAKQANQLYLLEPGRYSISSYNNMNAGRICAIIGTALSGLYIILFIVKVIILGATLGYLFSGFPFHSIFN